MLKSTQLILLRDADCHGSSNYNLLHTTFTLAPSNLTKPIGQYKRGDQAPRI